MKRYIWLLLLVSCSSGPEPDLDSPHAYGRYLGALQLAKSPSADSVRKLIGLLEDPDYLARSGAVVALGQKGDPEFSQHLIPLLSPENEPSGLVRSDACIALGRLKSTDAIQPLLDTLKSDEDPVVRREAARAAGNFGSDPGIIAGLVRALMDEDVSVAWRAEVSLRLRENPSMETVEIILSGREDPDVRIRAGVADAISLIGRAELAPRLLPITDSSGLVRRRNCLALGLLGNPATLEALLGVLKSDPDETVRTAAVRSLAHFDMSSSLTEGLLSALEDSSRLVQAQAQQTLILLTGATEVERERDAWVEYLKENP